MLKISEAKSDDEEVVTSLKEHISPPSELNSFESLGQTVNKKQKKKTKKKMSKEGSTASNSQNEGSVDDENKKIAKEETEKKVKHYIKIRTSLMLKIFEYYGNVNEFEKFFPLVHGLENKWRESMKNFEDIVKQNEAYAKIVRINLSDEYMEDILHIDKYFYYRIDFELSGEYAYHELYAIFRGHNTHQNKGKLMINSMNCRINSEDEYRAFNRMLTEYIKAGYDPLKITINLQDGYKLSNSGETMYRGYFDGRKKALEVVINEKNAMPYMSEPDTDFKVRIVDQLMTDIDSIIDVKDHHL